MSTSTIHVRLKNIFESLNLTTYQISKVLDENSSKFYNIMNGKAKPSFDTLFKLIDNYPAINPNYLLRGQGPVLLDTAQEGQILDLASYETIPLVPVKFYASFIENFTDGLKQSDLEEYPVLKSALKGKKKPVVIEIQGNSMSPQLQSGNKVLASYVPESDWAYVSSGVYAVVYRDFFVVKRIKDNDLLTKGQVTLHSDNVSSGNITIPIAEIKGLWKITNIIEAVVE